MLFCLGFFDIYNEEKGNMEQHAVNILNVSDTFFVFAWCLAEMSKTRDVKKIYQKFDYQIILLF